MLAPLDNFYQVAEEPRQSALLCLRQEILQFSPEIIEHYKYGGPFFYYKNKPLCYLACSKKSGATYIGFVKGYRMKNRMLKSEGRTHIKVFYIDPEKDIDVKSQRVIIEEALAVGAGWK